MTDNEQAQRDALAESLSTPFQSWKMEVKVRNSWYPNEIYLPDETSANIYGLDLMWRWSTAEAVRAVPSTKPITHLWEDNRLIPVKPGDVA